MDVSILQQFFVSLRSVLLLTLPLSQFEIGLIMEESPRILIVCQVQEESSENTEAEANRQRGESTTNL